MKKMKNGFNKSNIVLISGFISLLILGGIYFKDIYYKPFIANNEVKSMRAALLATKKSVEPSNATPLSDAPLLEKAKVIYKAKLAENNYIFSLRKNVTFEPVFTNDKNYIKVSYNDMDGFYCAKLAIAFKNDVDLIIVNKTVVYNNTPLTIPMSIDIEHLAKTCNSTESFVQSFNFKR